MFPGVDGFAWDAGHIIFLGAFFAVLAVIAATLVRTAMRAVRDDKPARAEAIRWHEDFSELPAGERRCRHELAGEIASRQCPNEFDCRHCAKHPEFVAQFGAPAPSAAVEEIAGLRLPLDRLYHRGHTWAKPEQDGTYTVGLDELGEAVVSRPDVIELPAPGARVRTNGTAWTARKGPDTLRFLSPLDGVVLETNGGEDGWRLRVKPEPGSKTTHLLVGKEAVAWFRSEFQRLQEMLGDRTIGAALADGGVLVQDLDAACPTADWDAVRGSLFLEP